MRSFELTWSWRPWLPAELLKDELFAAREEIAEHASGVRVSGVVRVSTTEAGVRSVDGGGGPVAAAVGAVLERIAAHHHRELRPGGVTVRFTLVPAAPPIVFEELRPVEERKVRTSTFIAW